MARAGQRKCLSCGRYFDPDRRVGVRQRYCGADSCRHASKLASHKRWQCKPENLDYFHGPVHVARVQAWRMAHPGYVRRRPSAPALQDRCVLQLIDPQEESVIRTAGPWAPLQDLLGAAAPVLAGLIAHLFGVRLQDEMADTTGRLVQLGTDVMAGGGGVHDQTSALAAAAAARADAVQLG